MKSEMIFNAIGQIDDSFIEEAAPRAKMIKKRSWTKYGTIAACLVLVICAAVISIPKLFNVGDISDGEIAILSKNLNIYYVTENGTIASESVYVRCTADDILAEWMTLNKIEGVSLVECVYDNNGTVIVHGDATDPNTAVERTGGDYFTLNLTLSSAFATYVNSENGQLLVEALQKTFSDYGRVDEFNLIISDY